ncbi:MAG: GNAT family N-acetyltransferase [Chloroflexota bacterium]
MSVHVDSFGQPPIKTPMPGLRLKRPSPEDAPTLLCLVSSTEDPGGWWTHWAAPPTDDQSALRLIRALLQPHEHGCGTPLLLDCDGQFVGMINFKGITTGSRECDLGVWLAPEWQGRGLMTAACRAALDAGFVAFPFQKAVIRTSPGNRRAAALADRLGFTQVGPRPEDTAIGLPRYEMTAAQWRTRT